ncbi:hypothetical protein Mnod_0551 [Methylobacterium nodulans ORS 2060]|uniref:Uncharacterized protein n=1 Tax=Methylobacterium nodulans (strain LMG 21967 / CNCM I-2342 / ORS 2060) TaxID=460265 RepID=B8IDL7_METNO|nr:hypothetical protein Mnod_0551 [Methylobacterium nodulans ORS 2060]
MSCRSPRRAYDENGREILPPTIDMLRAEANRTAAVNLLLPARDKEIGLARLVLRASSAPAARSRMPGLYSARSNQQFHVSAEASSPAG